VAASNTPVHVVYVMGVGRSGSTLLDIALGSHPRVESVGELKNLVRGGWRENGYCACGSRVRECDFWPRVDALWRRQVEDVDLDAMAADMLDLLLLRKHRSWPAMVADGGRMDTVKRQLGGLYRAIAEVSGKQVVVDSSKAPGLGLLVGSIPGLRVSYIHLVRDGLGVARSFKKSFAKDEAGGVQRRIPGRSVWRAAAVWSLTNRLAERIGSRAPAGQVIRVRYEDLVGDCVGTLAKVGSMLDLDLRQVGETLVAGGGLRVGHNIGGNRIRMEGELHLRPLESNGSGGLSVVERLVFRSICGIMLRRYGYR